MPHRSPLTLALALAATSLAFAADPAAITFSKQQIDTFFTAEGGTIADFNGDGKMDIAAGPRIYAGPDFKKEKATVYRSPYAFDRLAYSNNFLTYTDDFNGDGRPDILVIGWPGKEAFWFENPGAGKPGDWPQHLAHFSVDTESPGFADIDGDGRKDIIAGSGGKLGYMTRDAKNPKAAWTFHAVTPPGKYQRYTHGIGIGDINGDGRQDLLEAAGWWEQPASLAGDPVWKFHAQAFGQGGAQMYVYDVNGDGKADVVTSLVAHGYGLSWFEQVRDAAGTITFVNHAIMSAKPEEKMNGVQFSQLHAVMLADIDGDGLLDIVTGKRHWAHGDKGDPDPNGAAVLYWFGLKRGAGGSVTYTPHLIDDASGVGCQFPVGDINGDGKPDLAIVNKKGAFVFLQK